MRKRARLNRRSVPFLLLALFQSVFVLILKKHKIKNTWVLFFSNIGMAFIFEYIVLNLFQAYTYKPTVLKNRYFDNIFGAILSQGLYIPVSSTFMSIFNMKWKWKVGFIIFFYCVERLFIFLKIYHINWWKPIYTVILLPIYYWLSDLLYKGLQQQKNITRTLATYLTTTVIETNIMFVLAYHGMIRFKIGKKQSNRFHFMIAPLYSLVMSGVSISLAKEKGLTIRILHLYMYIMIDSILKKLGILTLDRRQQKWTFLWHSFMVVSSRLIYRRIFRLDHH